jgi:hypothetical protein
MEPSGRCRRASPTPPFGVKLTGSRGCFHRRAVGFEPSNEGFIHDGAEQIRRGAADRSRAEAFDRSWSGYRSAQDGWNLALNCFRPYDDRLGCERSPDDPESIAEECRALGVTVEPSREISASRAHRATSFGRHGRSATEASPPAEDGAVRATRRSLSRPCVVLQTRPYAGARRRRVSGDCSRPPRRRVGRPALRGDHHASLISGEVDGSATARGILDAVAAVRSASPLAP